MRLVLALLLALSLGTTGRAQTAVPGNSSDVATADVSRLLGTWNCDGGTGGGSTTETYTRAGQTSVALGNAVRTSSGANGFVSETFVYAPSSATWTVTALPNRFFDGLRASGPVWARGSQWILAGTETFRKVTMPVRIVYTDLGGNSFRREHQVQGGGMWRDDAAYLCRRDTVATTPSGVATPVAFTPAIGIARPSPAPAPAIVRSTRATVSTRSTTPPVIVRSTTASPVVRSTTARVIASSATAPAVARSTMAPAVSRSTTAPAVTYSTAAPVVALSTTAPAVTRSTTAPAIIRSTATPVIAQSTTAPAVARSTTATPQPWRFAPWRFAPAPTATPRAVAATEGRDGSQRLAPAPAPTPKPTPQPTPLPKSTTMPRAKATEATASMNRRSAPAPKPTSPPAKRVALLPPAAARDDRPYGLIGSWACRTTNGEASTQTYTLGDDGAIALRNALTLDGRRYEIDETYRFDPTRGQWQNVTAGGAYRGTAAPWRGQTWVFDGIETEGTPSEVHMTYTTLGSTTFRRQFARSRSGSWVPYLSEVCRRS